MLSDMATESIFAAVKWLVTFLLGGASAAVVTYFTMKKTKVKSLENGVQCLLRAEIIRSYEKYVEQGYCPVHAKESLKRVYQAYRGLGGNDVATKLYHQTLSLPTNAPRARHETEYRMKYNGGEQNR